MITASHNPPEYNGYKVYWEDGAQITSPKDQFIMEEVNRISDYTCIQTMKKEEAIQKGLYQEIGQEMDDAYIEELKKQSIHPEMIAKQKDISIVYTPLHGAGNEPVQKILKEMGFTNVFVVPEQEKPDGDFPTVDYPNPEDKKAFALALKWAKERNAELVLATDPDADRLGVYVKEKETGEYIPLTGNMSAIAILNYLLAEKKRKAEIPQNAAIVKSIVSSTMADAIAKDYGVAVFDVLTGFKYIGEKIKEFEKTKEYTFLFGFEESYGCLVGTHARDKDGVVAVMMLCEAAAYYKEQNSSIEEELQKLYQKYGYYQEETMQVTLKGMDGAKKMQEMIDTMRKEPPKTLGGYKIQRIRDYKEKEILEVETGKKVATGLPKSNVLYYELENSAWCCVRPSGTEPKIKYYVGVRENTSQQAKEQIEKIQEDICHNLS